MFTYGTEEIGDEDSRVTWRGYGPSVFFHLILENVFSQLRIPPILSIKFIRFGGNSHHKQEIR